MASINIPAKKFYNGQTKTEYRSFLKKLIKIEENARIMHNRPLPSKKKTSVFDPYPVWSTFSLQQQALSFRQNYQAKVNKNVHVFARELCDQGKREYIVTTYGQFWSYYNQLKDSKKNFYELIPESAQCRLYFDLEFSKTANPDLDGVEVLQIFINLICYYIKELFNIACDRKNVIDLDSTTDAKFSRHLIFHLPNAVFLNNIACGNFVKYVYEMARKKLDNQEIAEIKLTDSTNKLIPPPDDLCIEKLFVKNSDGGTTFFCDLSVYSRNRNFRIMGSRKIGKNIPLVVSEQNCFALSLERDKRFKFEGDPSYKFFLQTLVCFDDRSDMDLQVLQFGKVSTSYRRNASQCPEGDSGMCSLHEEGYKTSPFPKLDQFISKQICKGGVQGIVRRWLHFPKTNVMIYDIDRNHWCGNIGRPHKSNHIYLVADLSHGVFYQKCHDPDCQIIDYKSEEKPIPSDVNPIMNDSEYLNDDFDDNTLDLIEAAELAECGDLFDDFDADDFECDMIDNKLDESDMVGFEAAFEDDFVFDGSEANHNADNGGDDNYVNHVNYDNYDTDKGHHDNHNRNADGSYDYANHYDVDTSEEVQGANQQIRSPGYHQARSDRRIYKCTKHRPASSFSNVTIDGNTERGMENEIVSSNCIQCVSNYMGNDSSFNADENKTKVWEEHSAGLLNVGSVSDNSMCQCVPECKYHPEKVLEPSKVNNEFSVMSAAVSIPMCCNIANFLTPPINVSQSCKISKLKFQRSCDSSFNDQRRVHEIRSSKEMDHYKADSSRNSRNHSIDLHVHDDSMETLRPIPQNRSRLQNNTLNSHRNLEKSKGIPVENNGPKLPYIDDWDFDCNLRPVGNLEEESSINPDLDISTDYLDANTANNENTLPSKCKSGQSGIRNQRCPIKSDPDGYSSSGNGSYKTQLDSNNELPAGKSDLSILKGNLSDFVLDDDFNDEFFNF